jgi:hypothetical protein
MKLKRLGFRAGFRVVRGNRGSQAAEMVISPGDAEGDPRNRHRGADQWLFVVAGRGEARATGDQEHRAQASAYAELLRASGVFDQR